MRLSRHQTPGELRDAGEVAFGILVLGILIAVGSLLLAVPLTAALHLPPHGGAPLTRILGVAAAIWATGMAFVLRHYRRATRAWVGERRGGPMLFLVEAVTTVLSLAANLLFSGSNDDLARAATVCFSAFLLLLVCSHLAAYALLRYVPRVREVAVWSALAGALAFEILRNR
jgi:hypothetical protein